jgi:polyisoprenoid-binding protein YceI
VRGDVRGRFTLRGVSRPITVHATVRRIPLGPEHAGLANVGIDADMLRIQGEFEIALSDYGIQVPALLQLKVSNTIRLRVDLTAYRNRG